MTETPPEGLEEVEYNPFGDALRPYRNSGRYIILKGKFKGSFVDSIPTGYLKKAVLDKWDLTDEERRIFTEAANRNDL